MSVGTLNSHQLRSLVEDKWQRDSDAVAVGLHVAQPWKLPKMVEFGFGNAEVVRADTVFQVREALRDAERNKSRIILLTKLRQGDLGNDVVARLARSRLFAIDHWASLCSLFKAKELDRSICDASLAEALLECAPADGYSGLVLVLDEIETLQRVRGDVREKGLNALRQLIDDIDGGRFPNLYLLTTGTPAFFDGPQGVRRLEPLAQRLHVDFQTDPRFDNPRAVQLRLSAFDHDRLLEVGIKVRDLYAADCTSPDRVRRLAPNEYIDLLARSVTGKLGGKIGSPHPRYTPTSEPSSFVCSPPRVTSQGCRLRESHATAATACASTHTAAGASPRPASANR